MQAAFNDSVFDKVVRAVEQVTRFKAHEISPSTRLADDLALGRVGRLKLAIHLEDIFAIEISDEALQRFVSIADIVSYSSHRYFRDIELPTLAVAA